MSDYLYLGNKTTVIADGRMSNGSVKKLWNSFTLTTGEICFETGEELTLRFGDTPLPILSEGKEYVLTVDDNGAAIVGKDYGGLMRGFMSLLMKIEQDQNAFRIRATTEESNYKISNRMLHICVFPENDLYFIKKLIRLAALCQYTHIIIEFWGTLRYDCLKELAWPQAFTKAQAKELIAECRELGMEPIPMFNQLGHATASRSWSGKHVVLDQNPKLQHLFTPDGWVWNIENPEVRVLLKQVREELYDLFGEGEYMHIGCDEADFIAKNPVLYKKLLPYLQDLTCSVEREGRRPMLWMDMLLEKGAFPNCYCVGDAEEVKKIRAAVAKSSVFVDWQYECTDTPIPSLVSLKNSGRDVMGAPWFKAENYCAHIQTISENDLHGIMLTTWNTLRNQIHSILGCAKKCGASTFPWSEFSELREETATILRRISFEGNSYEDCGWLKKQVEV